MLNQRAVRVTYLEDNLLRSPLLARAHVQFPPLPCCLPQRMLGPLTDQHLQLFLKNPRFVGLKFPDMSKPETLQKRFVGKVRESALDGAPPCSPPPAPRTRWLLRC